MSIQQVPLGNTGFMISRLGLGTVEIGLPYGIGVKSLPSDQEAGRILKSALEQGVTYFDTARGYGVAEERLGAFGISQRDDVVVGTKCGQFLREAPTMSGAELDRRIREDIDMSRRQLQRDQLHLVQLHIERPDFANFPELLDILHQLQAEGKVAHVGVATRGEAAPLAAFATGVVETSQVAYSILDQRMSQRVLPAAQAQGIGVINRSVLLKGALTPAFQALPEQLAPLKARAHDATEVAAEIGVDLPTLAIRFAASHPAISTILLGTIDPEHIRIAAAAVAAGPVPAEALSRLHMLGLTDEQQVDPAQWPALS